MFSVKYPKKNSQSKDLSQTQPCLKWIGSMFFSVLLSSHSQSFAQTDFQLNETNFKIPSGESKVQLANPSAAETKNMSADFYLETYNYNSAFDSARSLGNPYQENHFGLNVAYKNSDFKKLTFKSIFQTDLNKAQNSVFAVPELSQTYVLSKQDQNHDILYVGRVTHFTNDIDQRLHLGLVHPYFSQDHLNYETLGLTGIEYEKSIEQKRIYFGFYPVFLPNQDPGVSVENGRIVAQNRWANQAPKYFVFNDRTKEINYEIKNYKIADIVFNPAYRFGVDIPVSKAVERVALGYKRAPLNNIVLTRETYADLDIQGQVKLAPVVNYSNQIYSDVQWGLPKGRLIYSFVYDKPDSLTAPKDQSIQSMSALNVNSLTFELPYQNQSFEQSVYVTYAMITGGQISDVNNDGSQNIVTVSKNRQQYFNPIKIGAKNKFYYRLKNPIQTQIAYLLDEVQKGSLLSADAQYALNDAAQIKLGFDILGSDFRASDDQASQYFLVKSQGFDRLFAGFSYVY